jgi:hypothetical protein
VNSTDSASGSTSLCLRCPSPIGWRKGVGRNVGRLGLGGGGGDSDRLELLILAQDR